MRVTNHTIRLFQTVSLEPTISSKISPKVLIVFSYLAGFGLLEKPLQFLKFSKRWHLIYCNTLERIKFKYLDLL